MSLRDDQLATLKAAGKDFDYYNIANLDGIDHLPYSLKVLVENLVRNIDGANITDEHVKTLLDWDPNAEPSHEIQFTPSRVIMQDFTGVPCIVDLATMRDAVKDLGGDPEVINPQVQSDMVIDHSVQIDKYGIADAVQQNMDIEYQRNGERYQFLRWGQQAFKNFRVVPPGTGIIHQVNIEYLAKVVMSKAEANGNALAYLDSCVGTDSHTTTENGLGVLGWGVGGIEAEAAMLGQPISMLVPRVVGFKLTGSIPEGVTATDVVLTITDMLRKHGVVGKFVEFYGEGIASVPLANRATIGNMGPEFGSTCGIFPIDNVTLDYLRLTGRSEEQVALVEAYAKANKLWGDASDPDYVEPQYSEYEELDLGTVVPSIAGPKRPQDRILLSEAKSMFEKTAPAYETEKTVKDPVAVSTDFRGDFDIENGDVAIASITSCTNTSNPSVMIAAGLIARNAHAKGLKPKPWVKTSLAPGSQVVADYLKAAGLQDDLDALGYQLVGFGCATCIGNSGPLLPEISEAINANDLTVTAVLSGNRNFEGRISPDVKMNYLASPPLVIAYALAGTMDFDFETQPLGTDADGNDVYLKDIWPTNCRGRRRGRRQREPRDVPQGLRLRVRRRPPLEGPRRAGRRAVRVERQVHLRAQANLLRRHEGHAGPGRRYPRRPRAGPPGRLGHHRPHLPGRRVQGLQPGRQVSDRARRGAEELQLLRFSPRQPRDHGARHVRQHPSAQPAARLRGRGGDARRLHLRLPRQEADHDLRSLPRLHRQQGAARGARRQGIRHRLLARLGRQGHGDARRQGRDHRKLRAHPPLQPDRHGRAAAAVPGRRIL